MWIKKILAFLLFSSLFIAACAVSLCMETSLLMGVSFNSISFYCFVFGATLVQYNLHYLVKTAAVSGSERLAWSLRHKQVHLALLGAGISLIVFSFFHFHLTHFLILAVFGGITMLYSLPLLPGKRRIKDYGLLKIITLALLWTLVTVWFPVNNAIADRVLFFFIFIKRFVFMFVLCLLFDIRDMEIDSKEKIYTVAVILGKKRAYLLSFGFLALFMLLSVAQYAYLPQLPFLAAMLLSALATAVVVQCTKKSNSDFIYLAGIDGMMLLQALLVYLFSLKL